MTEQLNDTALDQEFWYFAKNEKGTFDLEMRGLSGMKIKTLITLPKITRVQTEFCTEYDAELFMYLSAIYSQLRSNDEERYLKVVTSIVASSRYNTPLIVNKEDHFEHVNWSDLHIGSVVKMNINDSIINMFVTGLFSNSMQGVIMTQRKIAPLELYQNIYVRDFNVT